MTLPHFTNTAAPEIKVPEKYNLGETLHKFEFSTGDAEGKVKFSMVGGSTEYLDITKNGKLYIAEELPPTVTELSYAVSVSFREAGQEDWEYFELETFTIKIDTPPVLTVTQGDAATENAALNTVVGTYKVTDANDDNWTVWVEEKYEDIFSLRGGKIKIKDPAAFDFETLDGVRSEDGKTKTISVKVTALSRHDGYKTKSDEEIIEIKITDDGEPELVLRDFDIFNNEFVLQRSHEENETIGNIKLAGFDDVGAVELVVKSSDKKSESLRFGIDDDGNLKLLQALDDGKDGYLIYVQAFVGGEKKVEREIILNVNDISLDDDEASTDLDDEVIQQSGDYKVKFVFGRDGDNQKLNLEKNQEGEGTYGTWRVNDLGKMHYVPKADLDFGKANELIETISVKLTDGRGGTISQDVTVTIRAAIQINGNLTAREDSPLHPEGSLEALLADGNYKLRIKPTDSDKDAPEITGDGETEIEGTYGSLFINTNGTWRYEVDNENSDVEKLDGDDDDTDGAIGQLTESFTATFTNGGKTLTRTLQFTIDGGTDFYFKGNREVVNVRQPLDLRINGDDLSLHNNSEFLMVRRNTNGGEGDDVLIGRTGFDTMYGNNGNDILFGDDARDHLYGGRGDDVLIGGGGTDWLYGASGNDIFVLGAADEGLDTVEDFGSAVDRIRVDVSDSQKTTIEALSSDDAKLAKLQEAAQIRWTNDSDYQGQSTGFNDTIIYRIIGVADDAENRPENDANDVAIMVLDESSWTLTIDMFDIV